MPLSLAVHAAAISGGSFVSPKGRFPFVVRVSSYTPTGFFRGAGALISRDAVLTTASSFGSFLSVDVDFYDTAKPSGTSFMYQSAWNAVRASAVAVHPAYMGGGYVNRSYDIAILRLSTPAPIEAKPVPLDVYGTSYSSYFDTAHVMGWGKTYILPESKSLMSALVS